MNLYIIIPALHAVHPPTTVGVTSTTLFVDAIEIEGKSARVMRSTLENPERMYYCTIDINLTMLPT